MFTGGNEDKGNKGGQNEFIGAAMAQAAKLFDQQSSQGKTVSVLVLFTPKIITDLEQKPDATKQDAVASAAQMALKLYLKSEMKGGSGGGSSGGGGGAGGLLNLASKFLTK